MASFDEVQFDPTLGGKALGGPAYATVIVSVSSGAEQRVQQWSVGRLKWNLQQAGLQPTEVAYLVQFFRARGGRARGFRFKDWTDYTVTSQALANPYPATTMQLVKTYTDTGITETRTILKPVSGTVTVYQNGVALILGTDYTLDITTGIVTFLGSHPVSGAAYTWTGQFDVPVRFDVDHLQTSIEPGLYGSVQSIPLVELIYPANGVP